MKVDGVGTHPAVSHHAMKKSKPADDPSSPETTAAQAPEETEPQEKTRGVIRNLMDGHFKGVADVRLRINFFEEVQALEMQHLKSTAATSFDGFDQTVRAEIDALIDSGELTDDQVAALETFWTNLQAAKTAFADDPNATAQSLIQSLQSELDALINTLTSAPATPAAELQTDPPAELQAQPLEQTEPPTPDGTQPADPAQVSLMAEEPTAVEPDPLQLLVEAFRASVQQAIDDLESELTGSSALPPISEPSGNGTAFAKFMEIYEGMLNGTATEVEEPVALDAEEIIIPDEPAPPAEPV